jgi:uncharacterized glyoxalase superfamily protein PhnB
MSQEKKDNVMHAKFKIDGLFFMASDGHGVVISSWVITCILIYS